MGALFVGGCYLKNFVLLEGQSEDLKADWNSDGRAFIGR